MSSPQAVLIERGAGVLFREDAFQARVVALDRDHGVIDDLAYFRLLRAVLEIGPTRAGRNPEDVLGLVFVGVFRIGASVVAFAGEKRLVVFLKGIRDVFEEDEAEDDVLVFGRVHVGAELVGCEPKLGFETKIGGGVGGFRRTGHSRAVVVFVELEILHTGIRESTGKKIAESGIIGCNPWWRNGLIRLGGFRLDSAVGDRAYRGDLTC